jgi:hypothetical protein
VRLPGESGRFAPAHEGKGSYAIPDTKREVGVLFHWATTTAVRLGDLVFVRPFPSVATVCRELGLSPPTASKAIALLEDRGELEEVTGRLRGRIWAAPNVFDAIYGDDLG